MVAAAAPLAVSALIFAVTGSAYVLVFAALGPVIAVATVLDGRRSARRAVAREREALRRAHDALRGRVASHLARLEEEARDQAPAAGTILAGRAEHRRWAAAPREGPLPVALGTGSLPSGIRIDGGADPGAPPDDPRDEETWVLEEDLRRHSAQLADVPLVADLAGGVGIVGPLPLGRAAARGLLVQLAHLNPPGSVGVHGPDHPEWEWLAVLPHAAARSPATPVAVCERVHAHDGSCLLILAEHPEQLPPGCSAVLRLAGTGVATIIRAPGHSAGTPVRPELVSVAEASRFAGALADAADAAGIRASQTGLPERVPAAELWVDLPQPRRAAATLTLGCAVGRSADGVAAIDLVAAGPHAVVGGTTGSGKSELLVTWVTAMAAAYPPEQVTFLLVDFKGGSAFWPLVALPHCVGLVTDLDEGQAARVLASLQAEIRYRERALREVGARDVADPAAAVRLPRLVIVVDEFQAMLTAFDDLHALFTDLAARGRSLGMHLILCTQRPAGVVRDALLANCNLRVSLRVNNRADSVAVIGAADAADLRPGEPGRCLISAGDERLQLCQVAVTEEDDIRRVAERFRDSPEPRRPWCEPLPDTVTAADLAGVTADGVGADGPSAPSAPSAPRGAGVRILGLLDEPEEQRYRIAAYRPAVDGHLLVLGGAGSGKTGLVSTLAAAGEDWAVPATVEAVWDALEDVTVMLDPGGPEPGGRHPLLLLDDFDAVFARWGPEYQAAGLDRLTGLLREGRDSGIGVVITAQRLAGPLAQLTGLCPATLLLRMPNREAHRAAGGEAAQYDPHLPPGGGRWQGHRVQLLVPPRHTVTPWGKHRAAASAIPAGRPVLVVSARPAGIAAALRAERGDAAVVELGAGRSGQLELQALGAGTALVADPDTWQSHFGLLAALRTRTAIVFDRCSLTDYRLVSRRRDLPPVLAPEPDRLWLLAPDGEVTRAVWAAKR